MTPTAAMTAGGDRALVLDDENVRDAAGAVRHVVVDSVPAPGPENVEDVPLADGRQALRT